MADDRNRFTHLFREEIIANGNYLAQNSGEDILFKL